MISSFDQIKAGSVFRTTLWILGEYAVELSQVQNSITCIKDMMGPADFFKHSADQVDEKVPLIPITYSGIEFAILIDDNCKNHIIFL